LSQQGEHINDLLQLCKEGNAGAQLEVYNRYYKSIMQESFLSAFTKLHTFIGEVTFGSWLKKIVVNNSIHHYRKQQKKNEVALDTMLYKVKDDDGIDPDHGVTEMMAQKVMSAMNQLQDNYRVALTLFLIEGYDYEEISEIMKISYANCRTIISRAKESLRKKLTLVIQ
jgi:RNA polymerase sigma factor (sigma-70 family)